LGNKNKIVCVVTDNAANIVNAINECDWRHIPSYAHTVNLAVKDALQAGGLLAVSEYEKKNGISGHTERSIGVVEG
jgi:predicted methyltransferase